MKKVQQSSFDATVAAKRKCLAREIIIPHFPDKKVVEFAKDHAEFMDAEKFVEQALSMSGGYNFTGGGGKDFDDKDKSDCKTTSVNETSYQATVSNLKPKIGSLRIVCYNALKDTCDYFYVPKRDVEYEKISAGIDNERIVIGYSKKTITKYDKERGQYVRYYVDSYNKFDRYRVKDFVTLAKMTDAKFYKL